MYVRLVWSQGECDSNNQVTTDAYSTAFASVVNIWRSNLGQDLPFIALEIIETDSRDEEINAAINLVAFQNNMEVINSSGYDTDDDLHFNYTSLKVIGNEVMAAMLAQNPLLITSELI